MVSFNLEHFLREKIMKIGGKEIAGGYEAILVLPRGIDDQIVIRAKAVLDLDTFIALCPEPKAPGKLTKNGWEPNLKDENYQVAVLRHFEQKIAYLLIHSLEPTKIEWDTVDINNPRTWLNYMDDFKAAGFSSIEINRIVGLVMEANALDEAKLEKAREVFLRGQRQEQENSSIPTSEPAITQSGEPAKDSA
jgi:hypothetical protein